MGGCMGGIIFQKPIIHYHTTSYKRLKMGRLYGRLFLVLSTRKQSLHFTQTEAPFAPVRASVQTKRRLYFRIQLFFVYSLPK